MTDQEMKSVHEALHEAAIVRPELATENGLKLSAFREALRFIPNEFHARNTNLRDRFVASVVSNARAANRSPYTVALFALDVA